MGFIFCLHSVRRCYFNCDWNCICVDMLFSVIESIPDTHFNMRYFCSTNRRRTLNNILVSFHSKTTRLLITIAIRVPTVVGSTLEVIGAFRSSTNPHNSSWSTYSLQLLPRAIQILQSCPDVQINPYCQKSSEIIVVLLFSMFSQHVCVTIFGFLMLLNTSCYKCLLRAGFQCPYAHFNMRYFCSTNRSENSEQYTSQPPFKSNTSAYHNCHPSSNCGWEYLGGYWSFSKLY